MSSHSFIHRTLGTATLFLLMGLVHSPAQAADKPASKPAAPVATATSTALAAGSVEDSLQACLARIPKDATGGQRMIAEQSCRRDEGDRKPFQASGGR